MAQDPIIFSDLLNSEYEKFLQEASELRPDLHCPNDPNSIF